MIKITSKSIALLLVILSMSSCTNILDKPFSADNMEAIKEELDKDQTLHTKKKAYIIDNLEMVAGLSALGEVMDIESTSNEITREIILELSEAYDSIDAYMHDQLAINEKIEGFITLVDASTVSFDEYKGILVMDLLFRNSFGNDVLYTIIEYKYTDEYDSQYFKERAKITDQIAGKFDDTVEVATTEKYNDVAKFIYNKVPIKARKSLQEELGAKEANAKVERDFLMQGLEITCLGVVFKDKSQATFQEVSWKYLSE